MKSINVEMLSWRDCDCIKKIFIECLAFVKVYFKLFFMMFNV
jgi:hypothetical protein